MDLLDIDLPDTDLDLLDTDRDSFPVNIFLIFKTSLRRFMIRLTEVLKKCLEDVFKKCLEDILKKYLKHILKTSSV